ncbi:Similar to Serine/threonine-protein kinase tel1; acc. no. Q4WVM7 [Pyronema omphalodes CBS 100304]|uniref:Serine/threonine-protein kinase Tel1 n=1 Tax=Pyronema omphalodes (strain CBS 100304) TaxID=1076935 RepID=U4LEJ8_PYROM|nr:Similar to Serine/threonine-protein kinase tel1; acc. no. Q4WVM7 [Pyronema omphalodes CBS 100304]
MVGSVLRLAVQCGVATIKAKTVPTIWKHILETLPSGDTLCEPIKVDYIKALKVLFQHMPHTEHLRRKEWEKIATFCLENVQSQLGAAGEGSQREPSSTPAGSRGRATARKQTTRIAKETREFLLCLRYLLAAPNAPILENRVQLCETLMQFLRTQQKIDQAHQHVFYSLNCVLNVIAGNDLTLTYKVCDELVPIITRLWDTNTAGTKDQMIISLIHCRLHIKAQLRSHDSQRLRDNVGYLYEMLYNEYNTRATLTRDDREILQMDDVIFPSPTEKPDPEIPFRLKAIALRPGSVNDHKEEIWMVPQLIAMFVELLDASGNSDRIPHKKSTGGGDSPTRKRPRMYSRFGETMRYIRSIDVSRKLCALQVFTFLADLKAVDEDDFPSLVQDLIEASKHENPTITGWALAAIGSCAFLTCASEPVHSGLWHQVWQLCARYASNQHVCRIASHIMRIIATKDLVAYSTISSSVESMVRNDDGNGPSIVTDSSLALWSYLLRKRNTMPQSVTFNANEQIFAWFNTHWHPEREGLSSNNVKAQSYSQKILPGDVIDFLAVCCGVKPSAIERRTPRICGPIGQACIRASRCRSLYVTLLNEDDDESDKTDSKYMDSSLSSGTENINAELQELIVNMFEMRTKSVKDAWAAISSQHGGVTVAVLQNLVGYLLIAGTTLSMISGPGLIKARQVDVKLREGLLQDFFTYVESKNCSLGQVTGIYLAIEGILPKNISEILDQNSVFHDFLRGTAGQFLAGISRVSGDKVTSQSLTREPERDDDGMDLDFPEDSKEEEKVESTTKNREQLEVFCSKEASWLTTSLLITLCSLAQGDTTREDICAVFVDSCLLKLTSDKTPLVGPLIRDFIITAGEDLPMDLTIDLFMQAAEDLIGKYNVEASEIGMTTGLDILTALAPRWVPANSDPDLRENCEIFFHTIIPLVKQGDDISYSVRVALGRLCEQILLIDPVYGKPTAPENEASQPPSSRPPASSARNRRTQEEEPKKQDWWPRTLLIDLIEDPDLRVAYSAAHRMHVIFEVFGESQHLALTDMISQKLNSDPDWLEGLIIRVHAFGLMSHMSPTMVSRAIYRIFETGKIEEMGEYCARVLKTVARSAGLQNQRGLFRLFKDNLIYLFLKHYSSLNEVPYYVFGYKNFEDMCKDIPGDLVAHCFAHRKREDAEAVAQINGIPLQTLISDNFANVAAYALVWDAAVPAPRVQEGEAPQATLYSQLRKMFKDEKFAELIQTNFPQIIAIMFEMTQHEGTEAKFFDKEPDFGEARMHMEDIKAHGHLKHKVRITEPPVFPVKGIFGAIKFASNQITVDYREIWNPAMVVIVARRCFDSLHPARGPVHTLSVIRHIRLLISLAGRKVYEGYPLEMLIHGLKDYITDTMCAEDTIGILQYLLENGKEYLCKKPPFLIGVFLSLLAAIRKSRQIPSTQMQSQEPQLIDANSAIHMFSGWLKDHLAKCVFPRNQNEILHSIVRTALEFKQQGNAVHNSKESKLLKLLIDEDMKGSRSLLDPASRKLAFNLICSDFERPESYRDDIFGADKNSFTRANSLLRISRNSNVNDGFLLWSARVLGRAYASTGQLHIDWTKEMEFHFPKRDPVLTAQIDKAPKVEIMKRLKELLLSDDKKVVSLAEKALSWIIDGEAQIQEENSMSVLTDEESKALYWGERPVEKPPTKQSITHAGELKGSFITWVNDLAIAMCTNVPGVPVLNCIRDVLKNVDGVAEELFPYITHILLAMDINQNPIAPPGLRDELSALFQHCFNNCEEKTVPHNTVLIKTVLYLRSQQVVEGEASKAERDNWLALDYLDAAKAAATCKMFKTALLFAEIYSYEEKPAEIVNTSQRSRRESFQTKASEIIRLEVPTDLQLAIFENIDDPDAFYGIKQTFDLQTMMRNFEYEGDGLNMLWMQSASQQSKVSLGAPSSGSGLGLINAFNTLGMNDVSHSLLQTGASGSSSSPESADNAYLSAWKLEQWDLPCPEVFDTRSAQIYRALQSVNKTVGSRSVALRMDPHILSVMKQIKDGTRTGHALGDRMKTLAMLTEMEEVFISQSHEQLEEVCENMKRRTAWMETGTYSDVEEMLALRQVAFGSLSKRDHLRIHANLEPKQARLFEAEALVSSCKMARKHIALHHALSAAVKLSDIVQPCKEIGLDISGVATLQAANVFWEKGQLVPSIRMLASLENDKASASQTMAVGRAKLLAKLGNRISEARLEQPDTIMSTYLERAIRALRGNEHGSEPGRVFHEFAKFCDQQLNDRSNTEDLERRTKLLDESRGDVDELMSLNSKVPSTARTPKTNQALQRELFKAKAWLALGEQEYVRLKAARDAFVEKSIFNYLKCLIACDDYDEDAVRFCSLWFEYYLMDRANDAASILDQVPSRKLAPLINQLSSRLLKEESKFQELLRKLMVRVCADHPFHAVYQLVAIAKTKAQDDAAVSRSKAAKLVLHTLKENNKGKMVSTVIVPAILTTASEYEILAHARTDKKKDGSRVSLAKLLSTQKRDSKMWETGIPDLGIPPPTMDIPIRADCDYSLVPRIRRFDQYATIADGLSAPKIIKCEADNGMVYKQLVKGGNDDLRQDAIMEQVFEQVSSVLQKGRTSRQRDLKIRRYKVIPLSATSGIIEFVANTIPLHDWLAPAHRKYHPNDLEFMTCRKIISDAAKKTRRDREKAFETVMRGFNPVMHYFFMHEFSGPDAWYTSRLAYTRSTAAISMLGHVLGLGDRHLNNILLDKGTGEVVHIDLGIAFEQARILPVPEVIPFRLSRDIVDGMGINGTEGTFRRCCEFTLEVLRNESYRVTTILDVLRYDPLYNWTVSPHRMKRIQESHLERSDVSRKGEQGSKSDGEGELEAKRALAVVADKLSKTLSVEATVNGLIQTAMDPRNLAVLYCGWSAYC